MKRLQVERSTTTPSSVRALVSLIMVATGAVVAAMPAAVQAVAARVFDVDGQAVIAIALSAGAFISAVINGALLESRLADPSIVVKTYIPKWASAAAIAGAALLIVFPAEWWASALGLPLCMIALLLGRTHGVTARLWRSELVGGLFLATGSLAAIWMAASGVDVALSAIGVSIVAIVLIRLVGSPVSAQVDNTSWSRVAWVGTETAVVASIPFVLNMTVFVLMGPGEAVAFRLVLTVLGVLQPVLGYLRTRLLSSMSMALTMAMAGMTVVTLLAVIACQVFGVFDVIFGSSWAYVTSVSVILGCLWKLLSVPEVLPFAAMRRRGAVREVFILRVISTAVYLALGVVSAATWGDSRAVFASFIVAEAFTLVLYFAADLRGRRAMFRASQSVAP